MNAEVTYYVDSSLIRPYKKKYPDKTQSIGTGY